MPYLSHAELWRKYGARKMGNGFFVALDWAKAFDSIFPEALTRALRRFGCPLKLVSVIGAIYENRTFVVQDNGICSNPKTQHYGICQGCPLSPFLFIIVMTVLLHDAKEDFENMYGISNEAFVVQDLVYADDTILIGADGDRVEGYMESVVHIGKEYGLQLNWNKVEALPCRMTVRMTSPFDENIQSRSSIICLGSLLSADGQIMSEINRRLGMAAKDFKILQSVWSHTNLTQAWKIYIFDSCIVQIIVWFSDCEFE